MSYKSGLVHTVFFVRWLKPELGDNKKILREIQASRHTQRSPLIYLAIAPEEGVAPDDAVRKEMAGSIDELLKYCASIHLVVEGSSFKRVAIRSVATGMFLLSGRRGRLMTHDSIIEALRKCGPLPVTPEQVLATAKMRGLVI